MSDAPHSQNIRQLTRDSFQNSAAHGFWDGETTAETIPSKLALIHSEVSEALESYRDPESDNLIKVPVSLVERLLDGGNEADTPGALRELADLLHKWDAKPKGLDIELADILIRVFDFAGHEGIDLDSALTRKMNYNKGRPPKHGRKV